MPMSADFKNRLTPRLAKIVDFFGTPFHIYDEKGILNTCQTLKKAFAGASFFQEYYAVKALPNPAVLALIRQVGFGFDCSSSTELTLSRDVGARGEEIMFTSNNTTREEFQLAAAEGGCLLNLDDITLVPKVPQMPELICFRYNPGPRRGGNAIIGKPEEAKYGVSHEQLVDAYRLARERGARRFGLHTMLVSNELQADYMVETTRMLLQEVERISAELGIVFEFINIGGGLGIPYRPEETPLDLAGMGLQITALLAAFEDQHGYQPKLFLESGRYVTGPHGVLVTTAINEKNIYRRYIGVDACMSALMRPGMYGAYHHIEVVGKPQGKNERVVDVVGSLCENNDKFAVQRPLPDIVPGDLLLIQDTGAHGHSMGFNYNGKLRPKELLLRSDGTVELIRREETPADYFATLTFAPRVLRPGAG
ncbi:MAG: diaminopimelate decarboxylase [Desulfobacteraceae bacterium]|nr:diaminopimelate decarboxylase [Desulfobacteraceae bacterium]